MAFHERFKPPLVRQVSLRDRFWAPRADLLVETTLPSQFALLESTGRLGNFRCAALALTGTLGLRHQGKCYDDSDVYKWLEACAYALVHRDDPSLRLMADEVIGVVAAAQMPDGYLDTFFQLNHPNLRFRNLGMMHEMYCAGHLFEAAAAWHEELDDFRLLDVATRLADLLDQEFGSDARAGYDGHAETELALLHLARASGEDRYRRLAFHMLDSRGHPEGPLEAELDDVEAQTLSPHARPFLCRDDTYHGEYAQDHLPLERHRVPVGHAVRCGYLYAAAAEWAQTQANPGLEDALLATWENLSQRRLYLTGGIGPSGDNEGFTTDFDLPNRSAYAETCASIAVSLWAAALLRATGSAEFADTYERALYNGTAAGISLSGDRYFYANPLESAGEHERAEWFTCACCPPNIARTIGSIARYALGVGESDLWIHLPMALEAHLTVSGIQVRLAIQSDYPWPGDIRIQVECSESASFALRLRLPGWAAECTLDLPDGEQAEYDEGYAVLSRDWSGLTELTFTCVQHPAWIRAGSRVLEDAGRVALQCGPLVYCAEAGDQTHAPQTLAVDPGLEVEPWEPDLNLGGRNVGGFAIEAWADPYVDPLYSPWEPSGGEPTTLRLVPYFAWANRGKQPMQVWLRCTPPR